MTAESSVTRKQGLRSWRLPGNLKQAHALRGQFVLPRGSPRTKPQRLLQTFARSGRPARATGQAPQLTGPWAQRCLLPAPPLLRYPCPRRLVLQISVTVLTREEGYGTLTIIILKRKITTIRKNVEKLETSSITDGNTNSLPL